MKKKLSVCLLLLLVVPSMAAIQAPPAIVPPPKAVTATELPQPFGWPLAISSNENISLNFHIDLDLLAPLGTGQGNAAVWFSDFAKLGHLGRNARSASGGRPLGEWIDAQKRTVTVTFLGTENRVLPPNDPLLREAEPWVDQANCHFYPGIFPVKGPETSLPNLLMMMTLGRSWIARGLQTGNIDDLRRTMRLGRLLRQDNVTLIQDLIGIALIRMSAGALYEMARSKGDTLQTTLASLVDAEGTAIRLESTIRARAINAEQLVETSGLLAQFFGPSSRIRDEEVDKLIEMAQKSADRRFRFEAMAELYVVKNSASGNLKKKAAAVLANLQRDRDPLIAANARWYASAKWNPKEWNLGVK